MSFLRRQPRSPAQTTAPESAAAKHIVRLRIQQMDCPTEETLIRQKLSRLDGVEQLDFNLLQRVLTVVYHGDALDRITAAIQSLGMQAAPLAPDAPVPTDAPSETKINGSLGIAGALAGLSELVVYMGAPAVLGAALALAAILLCGLNVYRKGWIALRHGNLNINALMSIAVTGALLIGQWPEAAMVMVLFNLAERIEARSLERARRAIRGLLDLTPTYALRQQADGAWQEVATAQLQVGDCVRVLPGQRIATDGSVIRGHSSVDQSPITGESLPIDKTVDDAVFAATVNVDGVFDYRVTAVAGDTTLARIIETVEQAQQARAPTQRFIDRFARIYTPVVIAIAVGVAILPPWLGGQAWLDALYQALALLIIACPCALVISTPVSIVSGLTAASRRGILIKGGVYLETGRQLKWIAVDKTGTITHGKPTQTRFQDCAPAAATQASNARILASLAAYSTHPVSQALAAAGPVNGQTRLDVQDFTALPGRGVSGVINGTYFVLGNRRLMREMGLADATVDARMNEWEHEGSSVVALSNRQHILALAAVADTVKPSSADAIAALHALGVRTLMLTGDNNATAQAIATQVGIDEVYGEQLPEDKLRAIETKRAAVGKIGMVGDGINDAPALARADIGFAMGAAGSGTAIETADVALMDDDLRKISVFIRLSRATHRILRQNIALALGIKGVFLALAVTGHTSLWMAVFADVGASLLVIANGLRLLRAAPLPRPHAHAHAHPHAGSSCCGQSRSIDASAPAPAVSRKNADCKTAIR